MSLITNFFTMRWKSFLSSKKTFERASEDKAKPFKGSQKLMPWEMKKSCEGQGTSLRRMVPEELHLRE